MIVCVRLERLERLVDEGGPLPRTGFQPWTGVYVSNTRRCNELRSGAGVTEGKEEMGRAGLIESCYSTPEY